MASGPLGRTQVVAAYDAGVAGSPVTAPDPTTQGWALSTIAGDQIVATGVSPDGATGLNAWRIEDNATYARAHYEARFTAQQVETAVTLGFELEATLRILSDSEWDCFMQFAEGTSVFDDRYLVFWTVSGSDVVVYDPFASVLLTCPGGNDGAYHT